MPQPNSTLLARLCADQRERWGRGERVLVEEYLRADPGLGADADAVLELIAGEVRAREGAGEAATVEEYQRRFPHLRARLEPSFGVPPPGGQTWDGPLDRATMGGRLPSPADPTGKFGTARESAPDATPSPDSLPFGASTGLRAALRDASAGPHPVARTATFQLGRIPPLPLPDVPGFDVLCELGKGGMGIVYKAWEHSLKRTVALKMVLGGGHARTEELERFAREAEAMAHLHHPNIVQVYRVGEQAGLPFFVLEYIEGCSLAERLAAAPLTAPESARTIELLARATHYAHTQHILHRDLKPANVLLEVKPGDEGAAFAVAPTKPGRPSGSKPGTSGTHASPHVLPGPGYAPKITDFGLAKRLDEAGQTLSGVVMGTPSYMPPEQAQGRTRDIGPWTDVYALGAILYECLTGRPPFRGTTAVDTIVQVVEVDPVPPSRLQPKCPRDLETVCLKCLQKEPNKRYASAEELAEDLARFLRGEPVWARAAGPIVRARKWVRRRPAAAGLVVMSALALVLGVVVGVKHLRDLENEVADIRHIEDERDRVRALLGEAGVALDRGKFDDAKVAVMRALERAGADPALGEFRPRAEELLGRAQEGVDEQNRLALARQRASEVLNELKQFRGARDRALSHAAQPIGIDKEGNRARARREAEEALRLFLAGDEGAAFLPLFDELPEDADRARVRAGCYELLLVLSDAIAPEGAGRGQLDEAERLLRRAAAMGIETSAQHERLADVLGRLERRDEADRERRLAGELLARLERAGEAPGADEPDARRARALDHFLRGSAPKRLEQLEQALLDLERAVQLDPDHFWARFFLAQCQLRSGQFAQAEVNLTYCLGDDPAFTWGYLSRGLAHTELGHKARRADAARSDFHFRAAESDFRRVEELRPDRQTRYALLVNRGTLHFRNDRLQEAYDALDEAARLMQRQAHAYVSLATVQERRGRPDRAEQMMERAIGIQPDRADHYRGRSHIRLARKDEKGALEDLNKAIALQSAVKDLRGPGMAALIEDHQRRGDILRRMRKYAEALRAYNQALALWLGRALWLDPGATFPPGKRAGLVRVGLARAECLLQWAQDEDVPNPAAAQRLFRQAVAAYDFYLRFPEAREWAASYRGRAVAHMRLGEFGAAVDDFTVALEIDPDAVTLAQRGRLYLEALDAPRAALPDFERAVGLGAEDALVFAGRGHARIRVDLGQRGEALNDAREALARPRPEKPLDQARLYYFVACIHAQAAGAEPDSRAGDDHKHMAVKYLQESMRALPQAEQRGFWRQHVKDGERLNRPLAALIGYSRFNSLDAKYGSEPPMPRR